nr:hypothetical protein FEE99_15225 [Pseudomonas sp. ef1]
MAGAERQRALVTRLEIDFPCGSEPARESAVSNAISFTDPPLSRAGSLPHIQRCRKNLIQII